MSTTRSLSLSPEHLEQFEAKAHADSKLLVGKIIYPQWVTAYTERGDTEDYDLDKKIPFRVQNTTKEDIEHWNDDWLDPYWDLAEVHPGETLQYLQDQMKNPPRELTSFWMFGHSYNRITGEKQPAKFDTKTPWWKRLAQILRLACK